MIHLYTSAFSLARFVTVVFTAQISYDALHSPGLAVLKIDPETGEYIGGYVVSAIR